MRTLISSCIGGLDAAPTTDGFTDATLREMATHHEQKSHGTRPRIGREYNLRQLRRSGELHRRIAGAINSGELGFAFDHPTLKGEDLAGALLRGILRPAGGQTPGYAAQGFPQAAGGVDVSAALTSVRPGIRKIKKLVTTLAVPPNTPEIMVQLPKSGYMEQPIVRIDGSAGGFQVVQGGTAQAITMNDIRTLVQRIRFELSSTVVPKSLSGLACDIIDNLDVAVINANANTVPTSASLSGIAGSTTTQPFVLELAPRFTISDQNLYGIPYLGALGTVPQLVIDFAPILGAAATSPLSAAAAGPTGSITNVQVRVDAWRIDLPAPVAPQSGTDAQGNSYTIPGEGLWAEASYLLVTKLVDTQDQVGAGAQKPFNIPIGPMYARLILLAYVNGLLDPETASPNSILDHAEIAVQQATTIESRAPWQYDSDYRKAYYKARPKGVYVHSGIDQSGTDEDLWVTADLGNFQLTPFATPNANGAVGTKFELYSQALQPITKPGLYA